MTGTIVRARILPAVVAALALLAIVKAAHLWLGFSSAGAADFIGQEKAAASSAPASSGAAEVYEPAAPAPPPSESDVERRILEKLADRRASLDAREENIKTRERLLEAAEKQLETRLAEFDARRKELDALKAEHEKRETDQFKALVGAYERMKAKDAARIFDALDEDILVPVASDMRTQALAGVLAEMTPEKARRLTKLLADRKRAEADGG